jgi:hypothetical protein
VINRVSMERTSNVSETISAPIIRNWRDINIILSKLTALQFTVPNCHEGFKSSLTHSLTHSWSWALLEKLPIVQLLENFPRILWNPEVHHRVHISHPPVPILSQIDPIPKVSNLRLQKCRLETGSFSMAVFFIYVYYGPCHTSSGYSPASHRGGQGSSLGQVMWDLWWTKWHWGWFSPSTSF